MANLKINWFKLTAKLVYCNLKFLGLAPYCFDSKTRKIRVGWKNFVLFAFTLIVWISFTWQRVQYFRTNTTVSGIQSNLLDKIWTYQFLIQYPLACLTIVYNFFKLRHVERFLQSILKFDNSITRSGWSIASDNPDILFFVAILLMNIFILCYCLLTFMFDGGLHEISRYVRMLSFFSFNLFFAMLSIQFIYSAFCILTRLKVLTTNFW